MLREPEWPDHEHHPQLAVHPKSLRGAAPIGEGRVDIKRIRYVSGLAGWDRCLGGGLVKGTRIYLTGQPGCGKSTLLLLALWLYAKSGLRCMYLSAEESRMEVEARYRNMGLPPLEALTLYDTESWESAHMEITRLRPKVIVLDSLNTFRTSSSKGEPGDDRQTMRLMELTKTLVQKAAWEPSMLIVGQLNAKGDPAGRKAITHHVTGHLHFDKDGRGMRVLRTKKNRHGGDGEVALFEFPPNNQRIREVADISSLLLRDSLGRPGVVAYPSVPTERIARALVVPVECSVSPQKEKGAPRSRSAQGLYEKALEDAVDRLADVGADLGGRSIRIQCPTIGDEVVADRASALAVCASILSSLYRLELPAAAAFGELSASNRVLPDVAVESRLESLRKANVGLAFGPPLGDVAAPAGVHYVAVEDLGELHDHLKAMSPMPDPAAPVKSPKPPRHHDAPGAGEVPPWEDPPKPAGSDSPAAGSGAEVAP